MIVIRLVIAPQSAHKENFEILFGPTLSNHVGNAVHLCLGAPLVPARDAGTGLGSEFRPVCVVPNTCPPAHDRAARAQLSHLTPCQSC